MAYIFEYINHEFEGSIRDLIFHFKRLIGIEYLENLFRLSLEIKKTYDRTIRDKFENNQQLFNFETPNQIEFLQGDFLKHNWEDTSIIFANSTCFSLGMMQNIASKANKECKSGTIIITFTKRLTNLSTDWELRDGFRRLMTWGIATIYVHRRK